jgi:pilus assembly protein CpaE
VIATELTLAAARDTIRLLSWFKSNAPGCRLFVLANKVHPGAAGEISRKDFESSIERKIDVLIPFDQKLAAQAAKLGKPMAEAGKSSKTIAPLLSLAETVAGAGEEAAAAEGKPKKKGQSLLGKLGDLKAIMPKKAAKAG